jgi:non-ribosomal peptide synthetase component F
MAMKETRNGPDRSIDPYSLEQSNPQGSAAHENNFVSFESTAIEQSISDLFEQRVAAQPDRLAIKTSRGPLTYAALNESANRMARAILAECGEAEAPIALLLEQGAQSIAAIIGAWKSGKIVVPLDSSMPRARLARMVEDSQADPLVTDTRSLSLATELAGRRCRTFNVDELPGDLATDNLRLSVAPDRLAYILYTSGSTGQPKGIVWNHRNELHRIMTHTNGFRVAAHDRVALLRSPSFGAGMRDALVALLNGAALLPFDLRTHGLARLAEWLIGEQITLVTMTASMYLSLAAT